MKKIAFILLLLMCFSGRAEANRFAATSHADVWNHPEQFQIRMDYDGQTDGNPTYVGFSRKGIATSADEWVIYKLTYDGSRQLTLRQVAFGTWDNRASLTYE